MDHITSKTDQADLPPFSNMLENYLLARDNQPYKDKSDHWDVFPADYEKTISHTSHGPYSSATVFLSDSMTI